MSSNPGHEGALPHEEHGAHEDAGIGRFFFGRVPAGVHGGLKQYGLLAIFLAIVTLVEFLIIVPEGLQGSSVVIAPLVILSVIKFFCVVAFFMHLKFESPLLWQISSPASRWAWWLPCPWCCSSASSGPRPAPFRSIARRLLNITPKKSPTMKPW